MERDKLKLLLKKLKSLVDEIESEIYSDTQSYIEGFSSLPLSGDYDEVYNDDDGYCD